MAPQSRRSATSVPKGTAAALRRPQTSRLSANTTAKTTDGNAKAVFNVCPCQSVSAKPGAFAR